MLTNFLKKGESMISKVKLHPIRNWESATSIELVSQEDDRRLFFVELDFLCLWMSPFSISRAVWFTFSTDDTGTWSSNLTSYCSSMTSVGSDQTIELYWKKIKSFYTNYLHQERLDKTYWTAFFPSSISWWLSSNFPQMISLVKEPHFFLWFIIREIEVFFRT